MVLFFSEGLWEQPVKIANISHKLLKYFLSSTFLMFYFSISLLIIFFCFIWQNECKIPGKNTHCLINSPYITSSRCGANLSETILFCMVQRWKHYVLQVLRGHLIYVKQVSSFLTKQFCDKFRQILVKILECILLKRFYILSSAFVIFLFNVENLHFES